MAEIKITTTGELHLDGDVVGRIEWLKPYVESDVAGIFSQDDPFVNEWGERIDCTGCDDKIDLLEGAERDVRRIATKIRACIKSLEGMGLGEGRTASKLRDAQAVCENMEFET